MGKPWPPLPTELGWGVCLPSGRSGTEVVEFTGVPKEGLKISLSCCDGVAARESFSFEVDRTDSLSRDGGACVTGDETLRCGALSSDFCATDRWIPLLQIWLGLMY
jgi:hypothetical protein